MINLKTKITQIHYTRDPQGVLFEILKFWSYFYGAGSRIKNFLYDKGILKPKRVAAYVISVGNMTTGGVGKTPVVAEIAKYLVAKGERVAIVSRGYGGKLNNKNVKACPRTVAQGQAALKKFSFVLFSLNMTYVALS